MRCRECGLELDERDRLPSGAYQCPECGTIHHTASSSKVSPSPWRRKRKNRYSSPLDILTERRFGLPVWGWIAIALAVIIAVIVLLTALPSGGTEEMPATEDTPIVESTADPNASAAPMDDTEAALLNDVAGGAEQSGASTSGAATNTGAAFNDFQVSFGWAINQFGFTSSATFSAAETEADGSAVQSGSFEDWMTMRLRLDPATNVIRSATVTVQVPDAGVQLRALQGLVSVIYGLDNTINAKSCRVELESMITGLSTSYERTGFTATLTGGSTTVYTMEISGKLS